MDQDRQPQTGFAAVNRARLYYEMTGQGDPILLLHAGVADCRMWDEQFQVFARDYRVVRTDMRGFGQSAVPPGTFANHEDAAGLFDVLGIDKAVIVGVSFGGYVATDLTLAYPDRVEALVLSAPNISGFELSSAEIVRFGAEEDAALEQGDLEGATELNLRMWVDGPKRNPGQVDAKVRERVREMQMQAFSNPVPEGVEELALAPPAIGRLAEIQVPTLVIVGEQDVPEFVELADLVAQRIRGAKKVTIAGAAHLPSMEKPDLFNAIVLDFLGGLA